MRDNDAEIEAYKAKLPAEMEARRAVDAALACTPPDADVLRGYAGMRFDSLCDATCGTCGCAYCDARRALDRLAGNDSSGVNHLTPDSGEVGNG